MIKEDKVKKLLEKVETVTKEKKLDLSSDEDLSIGIMNLIAIEEHLFFTYQKTGKEKYLELLNEVRLMRTELLKEIIKDYEGEVWCISKHLLSASMRLIEVGTKELKKASGAEPFGSEPQGRRPAEAEKYKKKAAELFDKAYKLYSLFWGINLKAVEVEDIKREDTEVNLIDEKGNKKASVSLWDKLGVIVQKVIDCCRE